MFTKQVGIKFFLLGYIENSVAEGISNVKISSIFIYLLGLDATRVASNVAL